ncbi:regulatory LuxR family protein [Providencia alcalifaciens]|uniref:Regulatory LuxR family protein n=1 Tax=Providencia alcalifaciens TaxID=126385 RepID=A0A4R3NFW8_9GAMM|nr:MULTISPECIES: LuxR C-terminal-related transcriptional regulator [Providencia]MBC5792319.1 response regulator transcription factor [Providencia sp. JUb39]TCT28900.1 regulatory LuxR family protein [Providencia alcalifaciens]
MSTYDPIDLDAIKQAVFRENQPDFLNNVYFWIILDQDSHVLSCSSHEELPSILNSLKIPKKDKRFNISSIELVKHQSYPVVIAMEVIDLIFSHENNILKLKIYNYMQSSNINYRIFNSKLTIRKDGFYNKLNLSISMERLKNINPLELLTSTEWTVAWLVIHGLTNPEIALIMERSLETIKEHVSRILGASRLNVFNRYLLSDVAFQLNWDCFIPLFILEKYQ